MPWKSLVLGYHGCDQKVADDVVSGRVELRASRNDYDWLGEGSYFWEDSYDRAHRWAREESRKSGSRVTKPAVLGAVIDLGNCLNLIDSDHLSLVRAAHAAYLDLCRASESPPAENKGRDFRQRYLDRAVFETLHRLREREETPAFDTVRAFFVEGQPLYANAGLRDLDHIQICVRNPRRIVGYFHPRSDAG